MDFEQLRKDMEDGTDGQWTAYEFCGDHFVSFQSDDSGPALRVGSWFNQRETNARRIARVPDLERIALAAENFRKATAAYRSTEGGAEALSTFLDVEAARDELFALLTSKDAT